MLVLHRFEHSWLMLGSSRYANTVRPAVLPAVGLTTQIEVVKGCPPSALVPFFTHVTQVCNRFGWL
jgi:hypothetical protein